MISLILLILGVEEPKFIEEEKTEKEAKKTVEHLDEFQKEKKPKEAGRMYSENPKKFHQ